MFKTIKKVWRYIRKYKKLLFITLAAMLTVQVLNFASPLIVKSIMDDYLVSIENPWYVSNEGVSYNGKYYSQDNISDEGISIVIIKGKYYFIDELVDEEFTKGNKELISNSNNSYTINFKSQTNEVYSISGVSLLNKYDVKLFFTPAIEPLKVLVIIVGVRFFLQIIFMYIQRITTARININIVRDARIDAVTSLQKMPISYFEEEPAGKIANRVINDVNGMTNLFSTIMNLLVNASLSIVFAYIGMFYIDKTLALWTFIVFPVIFIWLKYFVRNLNSIAERVNEQSSLITAQLNEIINGVSILQVFNYEKETTDNFNNLSKSFMNEQLKETKLHLSIGWNMIRLLGALVTAVIVFYFGNGYLTIPGFVVTAGTIVAYNTYLTAIVEPVGILFREIGNLQHALVRTERIFTVIDSKQESSEYNVIDRYEGNIKFDNVWFTYPKGNGPVLKGVSLDIKAKSMVGIIGHTGSGKSTMMSLLLRFYDLEENDRGKIFIDDYNINDLPKRTYRSHIGIILQDPVLFTGTILDNVKFGSNKTEEEVIEILKSVGGNDLLNKFTNGIYEEINRGGSNLSIGERQIISFARVIAHDPSILIMDEATANIDTETEEIIQKALEKVKENRTLIVIAHRLSTIKNADKIIVLQGGLLEEEGKHSDLLSQNGIYANMYRSQIK